MLKNTHCAAGLLSLFLVLAGCHTAPPLPVVESQPVLLPEPLAPLATHLFKINDGDNVIGEIQITHATKDDTLSDIARRFNLGYEELVRANPGVDPWLPGEGKEIILPTQFVLPDAPREGLVVNLAALRVFYFPKRKAGELQTVVTHPIGIGKVGWVTPEGVTKVVSKRKDPTWTPPASVRKEHAERGDPLPRVVKAGPDNPLGAFAMNLGWPSYLIHGTNKPYGVGMRSSHGCMRFYPEDIALLFNDIAIGTKVQVVNQRFTSGWHDGKLYVQVMPISEEELALQKAKPATVKPLLSEAMLRKLELQAQQAGVQADVERIKLLVQQQSGVTTPVSVGQTQAQYLGAARLVENRLPTGATWNGSKELLVTAEEFEAMRDGVILPKNTAPKPDSSNSSKTSNKKTT
ncbi:MAG: L,D-transpeptidase family protein [Steroidobacteraceae bacterium]